MREGVGDEVPRGRVVGQDGGALRGGQHGHGVVEHGRAAVNLLLRRDVRAVVEGHTSHGGRHDLVHRPLVVERGRQGLEDRRVRAVGGQDAELASPEALGTVAHDAQRR